MSELNVTIFRWLNSWAGMSPFFDWVIIFRAQYLLYVIIVAVLLFPVMTLFRRFSALRIRNTEVAFVAGISAFLARFGFASAIRFFYNHPRPFEVLVGVRQLVDEPVGWSFPSGHASAAFAVAAAVSFYYPKTSVLFFLAAFSMSAARVAAGVHWPSDILGGVLVGIVAAWLVQWVRQRFFQKNKTAE